MKRRTICAIAALLILALLALPCAALAQEQAGPDAFTLTVNNFQVTIAGSPAIDVGLAMNLAAGLNQAGDRGLWVLDISGADTTVLNLIAALENGKVKGYLRNGLGGLPYLVEAPVEALSAMAQMIMPIGTGAAQPKGAGEFSALLESVQALAEASNDPAYHRSLRGKVQAAFETSFGLIPAGEETIELFGASKTAQKLTGETGFAGLWAALPGVFAADPALQACFEEAVGILNESGAFGQGKTFADLPGLLKESGNDFQISLAEYKAGENQIRLEIVITELQKGTKSGTLTFLIDSDASPDAPAMAASMSTNIPGAAEKNVTVSLESSHARQAEGETGLFGLMVETQGESGATFALRLETQQAGASSKLLLSGGIVSAADKSSYAASILYDSQVHEEGGVSTASGNVAVDVLQNGSSMMKLSFDTLFQPTSLSEGELLSTDGSLAMLDVTQMTGEQSTELTGAVNTLLNNTLGLLFQDPGLNKLLGGAMQ